MVRSRKLLLLYVFDDWLYPSDLPSSLLFAVFL